MGILKNVATGKFSLGITFWCFGVLGSLFFGKVGILLILSGNIKFLNAALFCRFIVSVMVLSGITFILKNNKITFWGMIAFIVFLIQTMFMLGSFLFYTIKELFFNE
ncbi:hypothetical protein [Budvicia diplopodorum]|uniref:hypothetical protein n=1 Tax=Budvicia diplopodorum TaxID=1119056 RepID=UPI00135C2F19|nr:hypothetical protein [Budvicia diplopodorum]